MHRALLGVSLERAVHSQREEGSRMISQRTSSRYACIDPRLAGLAASILALLVCGTARGQGVPARAGIAPAGDRRPAGVPAHYVITPHGYFDPSCIVELRSDEKLDAVDNIVAADGARRPLRMCLFPHYHKDGRAAGPLFEPPTVNSWVADVNSSSTGASSWISANWTVPHNPTSVCSNWQVLTSAANGGQTTLNTASYGEVLDWDFAGALEAYNVNVCQEYPP